MDEILKELDNVFTTISSIPVTYDAVDTMAVARAKLRHVYAQLKSMADAEEGGKQQDE